MAISTMHRAWFLLGLYAYEGTIQALDRFQRNVTQYGIPLALYMGRSTTYHSPAQPTMEEQLAGGKPRS